MAFHAEYPQGLIFQLAPIHNITVVMAISHIEHWRGHCSLYCWSTSDDPTRGDRLARPVSGGTLHLGEENMPCIATPAFQRIVRHLDGAGIAALVWTMGWGSGTRPWVPYYRLSDKQRARLSVSHVEENPASAQQNLMKVYEAAGW